MTRATSILPSQLENIASYRMIPASHAVLTEEQKGLLQRLDRFEAPYLEEKLLSDGEFQNKSNYQEAFTEFKKYAALSQIVKGHLGMTSVKVDTLWHQFVLFTKQYADFCRDYLGSFLHHSPHVSTTPEDRKKEGIVNFAKSYQQVFGEIPLI